MLDQHILIKSVVLEWIGKRALELVYARA